MLSITLVSNSYSAGSSSGGEGDGPKTKTNYEKPVKLIKFANKYEKKGILSNHLILFLQSGQKDRPLAMLPLVGSRYIQTLEKLPHKLPKMNTASENTI